jgi:hypothetical protein
MTSPSREAPPDEVVIIGHSTIFYWWPVWAVGFLMAAMTYLDGHLMAIVPNGTVAEVGRTVGGLDGPRDLLVLPMGVHLPTDGATKAVSQPRLRMAAGNGLGVIFTVTLCLVLVITNIDMRGLWSVIAILAVAFVSVLLAVLGWWDAILGAVGVIDIHINASGYLSISLFLLVIWSLTLLVYDRRVSTVFSRGQVRVRALIGGGETTYDTLGMRVEKRKDDVFRHGLLGFGAGDLAVTTSGSNAAHFEIPNVVGINRKLELIRRMLQEREVVSGKS